LTAGRLRPIHPSPGTDMAVTVKFFAIYRDLVGTSEIALDAGSGLTVAALYAQLLANRVDPRLRAVTLFAVNEHYVPEDTVVRDGDRVAFIPPVSGG
jgi:molybdopterin converting factor subunit 1